MKFLRCDMNSDGEAQGGKCRKKSSMSEEDVREDMKDDSKRKRRWYKTWLGLPKLFSVFVFVLQLLLSLHLIIAPSLTLRLFLLFIPSSSSSSSPTAVQVPSTSRRAKAFVSRKCECWLRHQGILLLVIKHQIWSQGFYFLLFSFPQIHYSELSGSCCSLMIRLLSHNFNNHKTSRWLLNLTLLLVCAETLISQIHCHMSQRAKEVHVFLWRFLFVWGRNCGRAAGDF